MQHPMVRSDNFSLKNLDAICGRDLRQLAQQNAAESASLEIVCDRKRDLSPSLSDNRIERMANNPLVFTTARNESKCVVQVCFPMSLRGDARAILKTVKPQPP
jgi:hypothetical protein